MMLGEVRSSSWHARGTAPSEPTVSVVIPAKNEAHNLLQVLSELPGDIHEVILVDGRSTDDTVALARWLRPDIITVEQTRKGRGNALACGFAVASGDVIATLNADGSNNPGELPRFVAALEAGADFAKGSRFLGGAGSADITRIRRLGNFCLNRLVSLVYRIRYTDLCYGYDAFRSDCLPLLSFDTQEPGAPGSGDTVLWGDGFEAETLIHLRVADAGLRVSEVPSFERSRGCRSSNLTALSDGLRVLRAIRLERRRVRHRVDGPPTAAHASRLLADVRRA